MARKNKGKYTPRNWETLGDTNHWTRLFDDMLNSPAFKALTPNAKLLYFYIKREYKGDWNEIKDTVILTYAQIVDRTGIRKGNIRKFLDELESFGLIRTLDSGGLFRVPNRYLLVPDWQNISELEAKRIKEEIRAVNRSAGRIPKGVQKKAIGLGSSQI